MNNEFWKIVQVEKLFGKLHTNCGTLISTNQNTFAKSYDKYND